MEGKKKHIIDDKGEGFLGVLKDEEEKKEEEMEQKMREDKEFKKFGNPNEIEEEEELKQEEEMMKEEIAKEEQSQELSQIKEEKKITKVYKKILPNESDEFKKIFKLNDNNNNIIKEVIIHNSKNAPITRCYLSSDYSSKRKKIICIGGSDKSSEQYNRIDLYDDNNHKWLKYKKRYNTFDIKISGMSSNMVNLCEDRNNNLREKIFLFGGYENYLDDFSTYSYLVDVNDMSYENLSYNVGKDGKSLAPTPRSYHTANYDPETQNIYIYGGTDFNPMNSKKDNFQCIWVFNLDGKYWNKIVLKNPNSRGAPRGHSSIFHKNRLFIFGGIQLFRKFTNSLSVIDIDTGSITDVDYSKTENSAKPKPTAFHSAVKIDNEKFIIHGGLNEKFNVVNDCYVFYFEERKFDKVDIPFLPKLFGHKLCLDSDKGSIFIMGGMDSFSDIGDKNLVISDDEEEDEEEENDKNLSEKNNDIITKPMEQIFELVLNNFNYSKKDNDDEKRRVKWSKFIVE